MDLVEQYGNWVVNHSFVYFIFIGIVVVLLFALPFLRIQRFKKTVKTLLALFIIALGVFLFMFSDFAGTVAWDNAKIHKTTVGNVTETTEEATADHLPVYKVVTKDGETMKVISDVSFDKEDEIRYKHFKNLNVVIGSKPNTEKMKKQLESLKEEQDAMKNNEN